MQVFGKHTSFWVLLGFFLIVGGNAACNRIGSNNSLSFNSDIRPILNEHCVQCHGGVKREAGLSLLFRQAALAKLESGDPAIIPGDAENSELYKRIIEHDPEMRMPLEDNALAEEDIQLLKRWINEGAEWETHWAYEQPQKVKVPRSSWGNGPIDAFINQKLRKEGIKPNPEADRYTLIRRLALDLTGLPPTVEETDAFVQDDSPNAYEKLVDRLLAKQSYGERWAAMWLDLARYADSKGYEKDQHRDIWMYRDWVIQAFNEDMPFDQFTIEQLAGDLLPDPHQSQLIATGFHRNTMNNSEGGVQNEEYRIVSVMDRVNTTWEVWNGTSFACVQCHGHPYDPFTHEEYYQFMDFFNNTRDEDIGDDSPNLKLYDKESEKEIAQLKDWIEEQEEDAKTWVEEIDDLLRITEPKVWSYKAELIEKAGTLGDDYLVEGRHGGIAVFRDFPLNNTSKFLFQGSSAAYDAKIIVRLDKVDGPIIGEWKLGPPGNTLEIFDLKRTEGFRDIYIHFQSPTAAIRGDQDRVGTLFWILPNEKLNIFDRLGGEPYKEQFLTLLRKKGNKTPILVENPSDFRRETHVFDRGSWLSPTKKIHMDVPASMPNRFEGYSQDRLGLAHWLVDGNNPLTSRVIVNRFWEQVFGMGIVLTLEDFGTQGERPTHPKLLDYLAKKFETEHGWSVKSLLKEMLMSAAYRQSSDSDPTKLDIDPYNRFLSRGPRYRLSAEQIRDQSLAVSGLLSKKMYGPSVMPHLPESAWNPVYPQYNSVNWALSEGEDKYRRGLYTYWKRSSPYPANITFDVQNRTLCASRRIRTNTPLQALVMLNDPVFVEAANALGKRMGDHSEALEEAIRFGYRCALVEEPKEETLRLLKELYIAAKDTFASNVKAQAVSHDTSYQEIGLHGPMAVVANAILNLDPFVMKE